MKTRRVRRGAHAVLVTVECARLTESKCRKNASRVFSTLQLTACGVALSALRVAADAMFSSAFSAT